MAYTVTFQTFQSFQAYLDFFFRIFGNLKNFGAPAPMVLRDKLDFGFLGFFENLKTSGTGADAQSMFAKRATLWIWENRGEREVRSGENGEH